MNNGITFKPRLRPFLAWIDIEYDCIISPIMPGRGRRSSIDSLRRVEICPQVKWFLLEANGMPHSKLGEREITGIG